MTQSQTNERYFQVEARSGVGKLFVRRATFEKMLQPRAAHSHYKIGRFTFCVKNHIFILNTVFFISHSGALGRHAPRLRTMHPVMVSMSGGAWSEDF